MTTDTKIKSSKTAPDAKERRVEDGWKLRELEMQTDFRIQTLSDSLNILKSDFHIWRDSVNKEIHNLSVKTQSLTYRLNIILILLAAQVVKAPDLIVRLLGM